MFTAVPYLESDLDETSVEDVVATETRIVSRHRSLKSKEKKRLTKRLNKAAHPFELRVKLVVLERHNSIAAYFICSMLEGLHRLRCLWRSGLLKNIMESIFTLLTRQTSPIIIKRFVWSNDNYQACIKYFCNTTGMNE